MWTVRIILAVFINCVSLVDGACVVNSTIMSFNEDVPKGTVIMAIPRTTGEMWSFKEDGPQGFIELQYDGSYVTFIFNKVPDLEEINKNRSKSKIRESLPFTLECQYKGWKHVYKQAIVLIDVNDNDPIFNLRIPLKTHIPEVTAVGSTVFNLRHLAEDTDISGRVVGYSIHSYNDPGTDGYDYFQVASGGHNVILQKNLDFDIMTSPYFMLNISAFDNGYPLPRRGYTSLKVIIDDVDDLGPVFVYDDCSVVDRFCSTPVYETVITRSFQGKLKIWPDVIKAVDKDKQNNSVLYSITKVDPVEYAGLFLMEETNGEISVTSPVQRTATDTIHIGIKVEEVSVNKRSITTNLRIQIRPSPSSISRLVNGFRDIPINDYITLDKFSEHSTTSIPISILMSTVGLLLVIVGVMLIVFVKYYKEISHSTPLRPLTGMYSSEPTRPPTPPPPPTRVISSPVTCATIRSNIRPPSTIYSSHDEDASSTSPSIGSSINLEFDDAISFAASKCRGSNMTSLPFASNIPCANTPSNFEENMGQILKRKLHNIFHNREQEESNSSKGSRVRFDIRNISSFS